MFEYRALVQRVIDADSIVVNLDMGFDNWEHNLHVRLFGIDAPERWTLSGKDARSFVEALLEPGAAITLTSEVYNPRDKYGRCLATIVLGDGRVLNDLLVEAGLAVAYDGGKRI